MPKARTPSRLRRPLGGSASAVHRLHIKAFEQRTLSADESEYHAFAFWHETQRCEVAGTFSVVLKEEVVDISLGKKALGHRLVAASAKIAALEIAAAHVDGNDHVIQAFGDSLIDGFDVEVD